MKQKSLLLFLLTSILVFSLVSAAPVSVTVSTPTALSKSTSSTSFSVTNRGTDPVNIVVAIPSAIDDGQGHSITISTTSQLVFNNIASNQGTGLINIIYTGDATNFKIGKLSSNMVITATSTVNSSFSQTQTIPLIFQNAFCKYGESGNNNLSISEVTIKNDDGDDTQWSPRNSINVKVRVENVGSQKISNIYVEIGLLDSKGRNIVNNLDNINNKKISLGSINDGDDKTAEFTFQAPADFKEETYFLVVKAYKSGKEADTCVSSSGDLDNTFYQSIDGIRESDSAKQVVVDNIKTSPEDIANCGEKVQITADIANIGDTDYSDQVKVTLVNSVLGLNLEKIINQDLNQGDSVSVDFDFDIPQNAAEKTYTLEFRTYYDYNSNSNSYSESSSQSFTKSLGVSGNCQAIPTGAAVQISADLDPETPEAIAGKQVIIKATLENTGTATSDYSVSIYGNSAWSSLVSIEPQTLTIAPGDSKDVSIVLSLDKAAEGEKDFTIKATSGTKTTEQPVAISIQKSSSQFSGIGQNLSKNWFIYLIIIVNVILIIAIILVIRRMVSPRKEFD